MLTFRKRIAAALFIGLSAGSTGPTLVNASGHREAPIINNAPKAEGADFYLFKSYEPGRAGFVTLIATYWPVPTPSGREILFALDPEARYEMNIDNDGDANPDVIFAFRFSLAPSDRRDDGAVLSPETYTLEVSRRRKPSDTVSRFAAVRQAHTGETTFNVFGDHRLLQKSSDSASYDNRPSPSSATIPDCGGGRVFVGQHFGGFSLDVGEVIDVVNTQPVQPNDKKLKRADKKITTLALEVPISCLTRGRDPVIGAWMSTSIPKSSQPDSAAKNIDWLQRSRLGSPLLREWMISLKGKARYNVNPPSEDAYYIEDVQHPTLPLMIESLFGVRAPRVSSRNDLTGVFLTGIDGLNKPQTVRHAEMLRLNTLTPVLPAAQQSRLGVLGGDSAGFPNGRRPGDDVVDIVLRMAMGALLDVNEAPDGQLPYNDGTDINANLFDTTFPYLITPDIAL